MALQIKVIDIKSDMPFVKEARKKLFRAIEDAERNGPEILKIIHGRGSTGVGGEIKKAAQSTLATMYRGKRLRHVVFGDKTNQFEERANNASFEFPILKIDPDWRTSENAGVTFVIVIKSEKLK